MILDATLDEVDRCESPHNDMGSVRGQATMEVVVKVGEVV